MAARLRVARPKRPVAILMVEDIVVVGVDETIDKSRMRVENLRIVARSGLVFIPEALTIYKFDAILIVFQSRRKHL